VPGELREVRATVISRSRSETMAMTDHRSVQTVIGFYSRRSGSVIRSAQIAQQCIEGKRLRYRQADETSKTLMRLRSLADDGAG
jgi:hypothetical protein